MKSQTPLSVEEIPETLPRRQTQARADSWNDVLVVGAGPTGMACAIEAQKAGLKAIVIDKGCLVNSIYNYPTNMVFFTTPVSYTHLDVYKRQARETARLLRFKKTFFEVLGTKLKWGER